MRSRASHGGVDALLDPVGLQRDIHLVGEPQQGELAQCGEVAEAKVVAECGVDARGRIDESLRESIAQGLRARGR